MIPAGLLLAAGAGRRMGLPKALVELDGEPLVRRAVRTLVEGGAAPVVVVLGARADDVRAVLPADVAAVEAVGWRDGMGASLRAGLAALEDTAAARRGVLARAAYEGRPGHPVLLGRAHWPGVRNAAVGDAGARGYLAGRADVVLVECADLADPDDVDTPEQLAAFHDRRRRR